MVWSLLANGLEHVLHTLNAAQTKSGSLPLSPGHMTNDKCGQRSAKPSGWVALTKESESACQPLGWVEVEEKRMQRI